MKKSFVFHSSLCLCLPLAACLLLAACQEKGKSGRVSAEAGQNASVTAAVTPEAGPGDTSSLSVEGIEVVREPEKCLVVTFSAPLLPEQDLRGLVESDKFGVRCTFSADRLHIWPAEDTEGDFRLSLHAGILGKDGAKSTGEYVYDLSFGKLLPLVELVGNGVIAPAGEGIWFPFRAVGLNAVDVRITEVFRDNMRFFLQDNDLDEPNSWSLNRVGRIVCRRKIDLRQRTDSDLNQWNTFKVDLSKLFSFRSGTLYCVEIGFRKAYTVSYASDAFEADTHLSRREQRQAAENHDGDRFLLPIEEEEFHPGYDYRDAFITHCYNWQQSDNPQHAAYYSPYNRFVRRNVLCSDFGIVAKCDALDRTHLYVSSLTTAQAIAGAEVSLYDYQMQVVGQGRTDRQGTFSCKTDRQAHSVLVRKDDQFGYLRLSSGSLLPSAAFDVTGKQVQKGVKGFLYADRGVWRPGDSIYLNFVLEDRDRLLPEGYPLHFDLYNAKGQMVRRMVRQVGKGAIYPFHFATGPDDPTGNWTAVVKAGNVEFRKTLQVESIKPNRLKIGLTVSDTLFSAKRDYPIQLHAGWLTGAPAADLPATVDVEYKPFTPVFNQFRQYRFDAPASPWQATPVTVFNGRLSKDGSVRFPFRFTPETFVPGMLRATFTTRVAEGDGGFSIHYRSQAVSPYPHYAGIRIPFDQPEWNQLDNNVGHTVHIATVDELGRAVGMKEVEVKLYDLEYRWWYQGDRENLASYIGETYHKPVFSRRISTTGGKGEIVLPKDEKRFGSFLLTVTLPDGHTAGQVIYFGSSWGSRPQGDAQVLSLKSDKGKYLVGDPVRVTFPVSERGQAIVTVESSRGILSQERITPEGQLCEYTFTATASMAPNVYVSVHLLQPHAQTANDLPIRLFGVVPIEVEDPDTRLRPLLKVPETVRPEKPFAITLSEASGKAMDYTIALVDEGLLDLTRFATPDPWRDLYAREALSVKTYDLYHQVLGAFGSRLESMFTIGGSDERLDISKKREERFPPIVRVLGPFHLDAGRKGCHEVTLPPYIGSIRAMVVAASDGRYGNAQKDISVTEPLMVQAELPRVLAPGEQLQMSVNLFTMNDDIRHVALHFDTDGALQICGAKDTTVVVKGVGEHSIPLSLKTLSEEVPQDMSHLRVTATAGSRSAGCETAIAVRHRNPKTVRTLFRTLREGESWSGQVEMAGQESEACIELSSMPPLNLSHRLSYLTAYPHGCAEQTVSAVFPLLYLPGLLPLNQEEMTDMQHRITAGIARIQRFQTPGHGFATWPGSTQPHEWTSCYVTYFLTEASKAGYEVPDFLLKESLLYLQQQAKIYPVQEDAGKNLVQAYRLWVLASAGMPQMGSMNRLRANACLNNQGRYLLANAYLLAGQRSAADDLVDLRQTQADDFSTGSFGSTLRDRSLILQYLTASSSMEPALEVAREISSELSSSSWLSTQSTAYALIALQQFAIASNAAKSVRCDLEINGKKEMRIEGNLPFLRKQLPLEQGKGSFRATHTGQGTLFAVVTRQSLLPGVDSENISKGLNVSVSWCDKNGTPLQVSRLPQGTDFMAVVSVTNTTSLPVSDLVLTQAVASGWEILNSRLAGVASADESQEEFEYRDIRDDRVLTYFHLEAGETRTFTLPLRSAWRGTFVLPPVSCESMYAHDRWFAKQGGQKVTVI